MVSKTSSSFPPLRPGALLGEESPVRLVRRIGQGGMGDVWLAHDETLHVDRAVKILHADRTDPDERRRFVEEGRLMAGLGETPGLVHVHSAGVYSATGQPFLVMDALLLSTEGIRSICRDRLGLTLPAANRIADADGTSLPRPLTLQDILGDERDGSARQLPERAVLALARDIASALAHLHGRTPPVIHRDIKPANLLFAPDGRVRLGDFGIARELAPERLGLTRTGLQPGTRRYAAPEQLDGLSPTPAVDWYAFGVVLFRALYSSFPEWGEAFPTHSGLRPISPLWEPLLRDLLAKDPARRLASSAAFLARLDAIERSLSPQLRRRRKYGAFLGGVAVLGVLVFLGFLGTLGYLAKDNPAPASDNAETPKHQDAETPALSVSRTSDGLTALLPVRRAALLPPRLPDIWQGDDRGPLQLLNTFRMASVDTLLDESLAQIDSDVRRLLRDGDDAWSATPRGLVAANRAYYAAAAKLDRQLAQADSGDPVVPALRVCYAAALVRLSWTYVVNKEYAAADRPYKDAIAAITPLFEADAARYAPLRSWLLAERAYRMCAGRQFDKAAMDLLEAAHLWSHYTGETDDAGDLAQMAVLTASAGAMLKRDGASANALEATAYAIERLEQFAPAEVGDFPLADVQAGCHYRQAEVYRDTGSRLEALQNYRRALDLWRERYQSQGEPYRLTYAQVLGHAAAAHDGLEESRDAIALWDELVELLRPLLASDSAKYAPLIADILRYTARDFRRLGDEDSARVREAEAAKLQP